MPPSLLFYPSQNSLLCRTVPKFALSVYVSYDAFSRKGGHGRLADCRSKAATWIKIRVWDQPPNNSYVAPSFLDLTDSFCRRITSTTSEHSGHRLPKIKTHEQLLIDKERKKYLSIEPLHSPSTGITRTD